MSALTSLLVRDSVVSVKKIEEAIQKQVISGGEMSTVLLELGALPENVASAYEAAVYGLLPATRDEVLGVTSETARLVPAEVAEKYRVLPLHQTGTDLVVGAAAPLPAEVQEQLGFLLSAQVTVRIIGEVRLAAALHHHYGLPLPPRLRRLDTKLRKRDAGDVPVVKPLDLNRAERTATTSGHLSPRTGDEDDAGEVNRVGEGPGTAKWGALGLSDSGGPQLSNTRTSRGSVELNDPAVASNDAAAHHPSMPRPVSVAPPPEKPPSLAPGESALLAKHRGPLTAQKAVELLGEAETRDDIVAVSFAFAKQFFDCTIVFVVHDGSADGLVAEGGGLDHARIANVGVSVEHPGAFKQVAELLGPKVSALDETDADRGLVRELGRSSSMPCVLSPVAIRQRVVLVIYGDRDGEDFGMADVPELLAFTPRISEALQRLILKRKMRRGGKSSAAPDGRLADKKSRANQSWAPPAAAAEPVSVPKAPAVPSGITAGGNQRGSQNPAPPASEPPRRSQSPRRKPKTLSGVARPSSAPPPAAPAPSTPPANVPRPEAFDVLGVPRSAPPPPVVTPVEPTPEPAPEAPREPRPSGGYSQRGGHDDVVVRAPRRASQRPPGPSVVPGPAETPSQAPAQARRADPRRESGRSSSVPADVVSPRRVASALDASSPSAPPPAKNPSVPPRDAAPSAPPAAAVSSRPPDPDPDQPSIIVNMGGEVEGQVLSFLAAPDDQLDDAVERVVALGEAAFPELVRAFPGEDFEAPASPERADPARCGRILRVFAAHGESAVTYVGALLAHKDPAARHGALVLAMNLVAKDLIVPAGRLATDPSQAVADLAVAVVRRGRRHPTEVQRVCDALRSSARLPKNSPDERARALVALGAIRDAGAVPLLLGALERGQPPLEGAAHAALVVLTGQDFGRSAHKWKAWHSAFGERHRVEWLIDALGHPELDRRTDAFDELKQLTQAYFGYRPNGPRRERDQAVRKYRSWWGTEGRERFK